MGQPFVRDFSHNATASSTSITSASPPGTLAGDLVVFFLITFTAPNGNASGVTVGPTTSSGPNYWIRTFWKWAASGGAGNVGTWTFPSASNQALIAVAVGGLDSANPQSPIAAVNAAYMASTTTPTLPAYTVPRPNGLALTAFGANVAAPPAAASPGTLVDSVSNAGNTPGMSVSQQAGSFEQNQMGPYGLTGSNGSWSGISLYLADADAVPSATPVSPVDDAYLDEDDDVSLEWQVADDAGVLTSDVRYRSVGAAEWVTVTGLAGTALTVPAHTMSRGFQEWQVRANDSSGPGYWSGSATFKIVTLAAVRRDVSLRALVQRSSDPETDVVGAQYLNVTTGKVRLLTADGWADLSPTPAPAGPVLLAGAERGPASEVTYSTTSTSLQPVDTANLSVTFTAPTAKVEVRLEAFVHNTYSLSTLQWAMLNASGVQVGQAVLVRCDGTNGGRMVASWWVTVVPGTQYTWRWGFARSTRNTTQTAAVEMIASDGSTNTEVGPMRMEVWSTT